jgi:acetyl-CoA C-acetyltransferase
VCGSGLEAINLASLKISSGEASIIIAGGTENLDLYPFYIRKARYGYRFGHDRLEDGLKTVFTDSLAGLMMGEIGEKIAKKYKISRQKQDEYSLLSQQRALRAIKNGEFKDQIVPIEVQIKKEKAVFDTDEHPRKTSMEQLSKLKPAFINDGSVTAGNASGINDGAATVVAMADAIAKDYKLDPAISIVASAVSGCEPEYMGLGPIYSTKKALKKAGMGISDIDVFEINEAFASQVLAVIRDLKIPVEKVNVNGGAIALGHPIGATGAILMVKIMNIMKKNNYEYGLVSLCIGGGQGITTILKLEQ